MPRFDIHGNGTFAFASTLIYITSRIVEHAKHRNDAVGNSASPFDITACGTNVVNAHANSACRLRNQSTAFEGIENPCDTVFGHTQQEARRHLRFGRTCVEERWCGVDKPFFAHQVVSFNRCLNIFFVNAQGDTHKEMLRSFGYLSVGANEVRTLQGFESEVIKIIIAVVDDTAVEFIGVFTNDFINFFGDERCVGLGYGVGVFVEQLSGF